MVEEKPPAKRVVKKVVKKTPARPAASPQAPAPTVRYGRPVATAAKARVATRSNDRAGAGVPAVAKDAPRSTPQKTPRPKVRRQRPTLDVRARVDAARDVAGRAWWATADTVAGAAKSSGRIASKSARTVASWRLPHLNPYLASVVTGAVVGLVAVVLGAAALLTFEAARGVTSGGGFWGSLTFVVIAVAAVLLGESLLRGFGTPSARLTSFFAVVLAIIVMLGLLLGVVDGALAIAVVPVLGVVCYAASYWLINLAENAPAVTE